MIPLWVARLLVLAVVCTALNSCAGTVFGPIGEHPKAVRAAAGRSASSQTLYAYSPAVRPLISWYDAKASGRTVNPNGVLVGGRTGLIPINYGGGIALDQRGNLYVLTVDGTIGRSTLSIFDPGSRGNALPKRILNLAIQAGGLALDGRGHFWTANRPKGTMVRFPLWGGTHPHADAVIAPTLATSIGSQPAYASSVTLDAEGNVYCTCASLYHGLQSIGVSEYSVSAGGQSKLIRSFYDDQLPELPPSMIAIAPDGTIYVASTIESGGVFWYPPDTPSGDVAGHRFYGPRLHWVASIVTDASGNLYVAEGSHILVFKPGARGPYSIQDRTIGDRKHLKYPQFNGGSFLFVK